MKFMPQIIKLIFLCLSLGLTSPVFAQELDARELTQQKIEEINDYTSLIKQINQEKENAIGYQGRALNKQLSATAEAYRNLLWQFSDDLNQEEAKALRKEFSEFVISHLKAESEVLLKEIQQSNDAATKLEDSIMSAKKRVFTVNQAITKERLADLQWKLYLGRRTQEKLYSALVKNSIKLGQYNENVSLETSRAKELVKKQADTLSGLIGITKDKLLKLEKQISVVRNDSEPGKKLITDIALKNLEIKDYADRLQSMVNLLTEMEVDSSLYKKTVIQAQNTLTKEIFDKKVASHLFTEWWLKTKRWFSKQAPTIFSKTITFLSIIFLAWIVAAVVRRIIRGAFKRTRPNMSELAKNFIVSMSSKIIILIGLLIALSNLGIQIAPILAGLGIMGFIIGFAFQETLSNFASGLMILIYRPYDVGDKIRISGLEGKVSRMNLVSTTVFTSANHHLTIPNNKIWQDIIHNITSQTHVRMDLFFTAPFNAASDTVLEAITEEVDENAIVISDKEKNIRIFELEDSEVKYIARFWINSKDIDEAKWVISEGVKKRFDAKGISKEIIEGLKVRLR